MDIKKIMILNLGLLAGCATTPPPAMDVNDKTDATLAEAAYTISRSIVTLAESEQAAHPIPTTVDNPTPDNEEMGAIASVDWSGPVEPLVKHLAKAANYQMRVLGVSPAIPILVTVSAKNTLIADILRDAGFQCGNRADIVVFPTTQTVELRYAKN